MNIADFKGKFKFDPGKKLYIGVEREAFLVNEKSRIIPEAYTVLAHTNKDPRFSYELSACQVESKVGPCQISSLAKELNRAEEDLSSFMKDALRGLQMEIGLADWLGRDIPENVPQKLALLHTEVGPEDMPLDVYPDPTGRYVEITKDMPRHILLAACRVIGTHVHVGMPDHQTALRVYNRVITQFSLLCEKGNGSFGERLAIYRVMAPNFEPLPYKSWEAFYKAAVTGGFDQDPRRLWTLIRISMHGTIEFRMFGATSSLDRIVSWAKFCHDLCAEAI